MIVVYHNQVVLVQHLIIRKKKNDKKFCSLKIINEYQIFIFSFFLNPDQYKKCS